MDIPEEEEIEKRSKRLFEEIMAENVFKFDENINLHTPKVQPPPSKINSKRSIYVHILKAAREKVFLTYKGSSI